MRTKHYAFAAASAVLLVLVLATPALAAPGNAKPCLCYPLISPLTGTTKTVYVASVTYTDADGDAPAKVELYIDNVAHPMTHPKGSAKGYYRARLTLPPGEHSYYFYTEDARGESERFPRYGALTNLLVGTKKKILNRLPVLSEGGVYYNRGSEYNIYTYMVKYKDRDVCKPPKYVQVFIDGLPHDMALYSGTCVNGTYVYQTKLPPGPHAYYFIAKDGNGDGVALPAAGFIRGPEVTARLNSPPVLLDQRLEPGIGGMKTIWQTPSRYGFLVHYNDVDFDAPTVALIYIDNVPHAMKLIRGTASNGLYAYCGNQFLGNMHTYYYYFQDGKGASVRMPEVGVFHGPVVTR